MNDVFKTTTLRAAVATAARLGAALAVTAALAVPAAAMIVTRDMGGSVRERIVQINTLRAQGTPIRITGTCVSACTLFLGLPNACVTPSARLGFHGPSTRTRGLPLPAAEYERVSAQMAAMYPPRIARWFMTTARKTTDGYLLMSGREAIAMGARACD